eukprot:gene34543-46354_t
MESSSVPSSGQRGVDTTTDSAAEISSAVSNVWEQWKNKGNEFYHAKNYKSAIEAYSKALEDLDAGNSAAVQAVAVAPSTYVSLLLNRAAALLMLLQYREALVDCDRAISLDGNGNSKALFRKATALKGLGRLDEAIAALDGGLALDPKSGTALAEKQTLVRATAQLSEAKSLLREVLPIPQP